MNHRLFVGILAFMFVSGCTVTKEETLLSSTDGIDRYIEWQRKEQHIAGLSLAVVRSGKIVKAKGYGMADLARSVAAAPDTVYQIASVTKQFTATAIMLLNEDGKIRLSDSIALYLEDLPPSWQKITVFHLLTMTSGIQDCLTQILPESAWGEEFTPDRLKQIMVAAPLDFSPGDGFKYSNSNYILLAMIIEKVSGKPFYVFLKERVFGPLKMNDTYKDHPDDTASNRALPYEWKNGRLVNCRFLSSSLFDDGDGGLCTSVLDLAKWDAALYTEHVLQSRDLEQMWTPARLNNGTLTDYGFGWRIAESKAGKVIKHGGGRPGASAQITRYLDNQLTVIVLMNGDGDSVSIANFVAAQFIPGLQQ